jgi:hypothetical protein
MDEQLSNQAKEQTSQKTAVNDIVSKINQGRDTLGITAKVENPDTKNIGTNGYMVGSTYTLTGEVDLLVPVIINGVATSTYIGLKTEQNVTLNLAQIMGISSLRGYSIDPNQEFTQESNPVGDSNNPVTEKFCPDVVKGKDAHDIEQMLFQPQSRNLYEETAILMDNPEIIKGKKVTFLGTAYRPFTAKKDNSVMGYSAGMKRVIAQKLWAIEKTANNK